MAWMQFSPVFRLDPIATGSPQALVVMLHNRGASAPPLYPVATRWATSVPTTAFVALDGIEQLEPASSDHPEHAMIDGDSELPQIDRAARNLEPALESQLRSLRLNASRLVLVGFGYGGTVALHMVLHQGWNCAGVLAFAAKLMRPLPRGVRVSHKVRLIGRGGDVCHSSLREDVALLTARGIDTRGVLLSGSAMSDEAIRHGGAYLVELVATAQRGDRYRAERTAPASPSGKCTRVRDAGS
jgi:predicted esterase